MQLTIYIDGSSRNNPGEAGAGVLILKDDESAEHITQYLGVATNNVAEYKAAILGLERAVMLKASHVILYTDSMLLANHLSGTSRIRDGKLKQLGIEVRRLIAVIGNVEVQHIPRKRNKVADSLARTASEGKG